MWEFNSLKLLNLSSMPQNTRKHQKEKKNRMRLNFNSKLFQYLYQSFFAYANKLLGGRH